MLRICKGEKMKCEECKSESDGVPDCVIDGICPYDIEKVIR